MEFCFKIKSFWTFEQILGLGSDGLPVPAQLELGEIGEEKIVIPSFVIYTMIESLTAIENTPNRYLFTAKSIRTQNRSNTDRRLLIRQPQSYFSPICWKFAAGIFDRHGDFGVIELYNSSASQRRNYFTNLATKSLSTNRLMKVMNSIPLNSHP